MEKFTEGYAFLNPFTIEDRKGDVLFRKPGSLGGDPPQCLTLNRLEDCRADAKGAIHGRLWFRC